MSWADTVNGLFAAYGREASENQIRSYRAVLETGTDWAVKKAIAEAARGAFQRLPTAAEILKLSQEIIAEERGRGDRDQVEHNKICGHYAKMARSEKWSLAQSDELIRICDRAFDRHSKTWRWTREKLSSEISELVREVETFRDQKKEAEDRGTEPPDESGCSWGWALPKPGEVDWNPAAESLWECVQRIAKNGSGFGTVRNESGDWSG